MDSNILRKRLADVIDSKRLTYTKIEKEAGLPRASLRNFIVGNVKEPKLDVILAVARVLQVELNDLLYASSETENGRNTKKEASQEISVETQLLLDCVRSVVDYITRNNITLSFEKSMDIVKDIYDYSIKYTGKKLDSSFLDWYMNSSKF